MILKYKKPHALDVTLANDRMVYEYSYYISFCLYILKGFEYTVNEYQAVLFKEFIKHKISKVIFFENFEWVKKNE